VDKELGTPEIEMFCLITAKGSAWGPCLSRHRDGSQGRTSVRTLDRSPGAPSEDGFRASADWLRAMTPVRTRTDHARLRSIGRSCVPWLSRSARHLAATRLPGTNRRTDPFLACSASSFVETPGASKMPHFDFSKRQVPRAPGEPLRVPIETLPCGGWPSLRLARSRSGAMSDGRRHIA